MEMTLSNAIPIAVLTASLLGSAHCLGMCGPIVLASARGFKATAVYQLGRLSGYLLLGALTGFLGQTVLFRAGSGAFPKIAAVVSALAIGAALIALGLRQLRGRSAHLSSASEAAKGRKSLPGRMLQKTWSWAMRLHPLPRAGAIGFLSIFLPCGWLYGFVLAAAATASVTQGALTLFLFWLGTVPALLGAPFLINRLFRPLAARAPRTVGVLLIVAGLLTIGIRLGPAIQGEPKPSHCHETSV